MPLQNRVDPFGSIVASPARGMFTGNRGVIHDPATKTLLRRRWTTRAWIICACQYKGRRREVFGRNAPGGGAGWTELFFLDEPTALAAGHRPCFTCRREAARAYAQAFSDAFGVAEPKVAEMDARLHAERLATGTPAVPLDAAQLTSLPSGTFVTIDGAPHALRKGRLLPWTFDGYGPACDTGGITGPVAVLTPAATIACLRAGFSPVWHHSAG